MNLNLLNTFITIVEEGNFSKAAAKLHLSQPAVSMQMQTLSTELGMNLFLRVGKKVQLTEGGNLLYNQGKLILNNWSDVLAQLDAYKTHISGKLRIGASTIPGQYFLPKTLKSYKENYPNTDLSIIIKDSQEIIQELTEGSLDIAFIGKRINKSGISCCRWLLDKLVLIKAKDLEVSVEPNSKKDFLKIPFVVRKDGSGTRKSMEERLKNLGIKMEDMNIVLELESTENIIAAVETGMGVSLVSEVAAQRGVKLGTLDIISSSLEIEREIYYAFRHDQLKSNTLESFLGYLGNGGGEAG
ncbi:LysR family transcriptional regulator [Alkalicella caledoniensis]|uniref:LysR family transcriptional regulator n=1 Tax=Alkalicella caledoniensis TaxID=2731377 RepID=A0A7G9W954_ALKCA|nr:selenium metabolism-associated LysR family transcriptional regulator [Alkalicella caledoniensis]QNO15216.1 LysR family transcriptional regulator [Alkalicella caledoniensis]